MNLSSAGFLRSLPAYIALLAVGCAQTSQRLWDTASSRRYSHETRFQVARLQESQGDQRSLQKAEEAYRGIYEKDSTNVAALHRLAVVSARQNKLDESIVHFQNAIAIAPSRPNLMADYGHALFLKGDLKNAEAALKTAVNQNPGNSRSVNNLARVIGYQGRDEECLATYRRLKSEAEARSNLAYIHAQRGLGPKAKQECLRALALDPKLKSAKNLLVQLAEYEQRFLETPRGRQVLAKHKAAPKLENLNDAIASNSATVSDKSRIPPTPSLAAKRVGKHSAPKRTATRPKPRTPVIGDSIFDLAETERPKATVRQATAKSTESGTNSSIETAGGFKSNYVIPSADADRQTEEPAPRTYQSASDIRRIPEKSSRHFAREATKSKPLQQSNDSGSSVPPAAKKTRLFNNEDFNWARNNRRSPDRFKKPENRTASADAGDNPEPKPFPKMAPSRPQPTPKPMLTPKPITPTTLTTPTPKTTATAIPKRTVVTKSVSSKWARRPQTLQVVHQTKSDIDAPRRPVERKIKRVSYESHDPELNLGNEWDSNPPVRKAQPRREVSRFRRRAVTPATETKPAPLRQASASQTATKKTNPKGFANFVDWSKAEKESAAASNVKPTKPATSSKQPIVKPAAKPAAPKASGWAPRRKKVTSAKPETRNTEKIVLSSKPVRLSLRAEPTSRPAGSGRVRLTPASVTERNPTRFKVEPPREDRSLVGRVRLLPNVETDKGRVRLSAE